MKVVSLLYVIAVFPPLGLELEPVVFQHNTEPFAVPAQQTAMQSFMPGEGHLNGLIITVPADRKTPVLKVAILDKDFNVLRQGMYAKTQYGRDYNSVHYSFPALTTSLTDTLSASLKSVTGQSFRILVSHSGYDQGELSIGQVKHDDLDMVMSLRRPSVIPPATFLGIIAGVGLTLAIAAVRLVSLHWPRAQWLGAALALSVVIILSMLPLIYRTGQLAISDWDFYLSYFTHLKRTVLDYHQFPLWNPWICGGTSAIGDPEFPVVSPFFPLILLLEIPTGLVFAAILSIIGTGWGMLALSKRLGLSSEAALIAALPAALGSALLLKIAEGHMMNITLSWLWFPWTLWAWLAAYKVAGGAAGGPPTAGSTAPPDGGVPRQDPRDTIRDQVRLRTLVTGILLALTFFQGGIYALVYTGLTLAGIVALARRRLHALLVTIMAAVWALGLSAAKLLPVADWLRQFPEKMYSMSSFTLPYLDQLFLGRLLHGSEGVFPGQNGGWHEYGSYIGPVILLLALVGLSQWRRRIVRAIAAGSLAALLTSTAGPFLEPLLKSLSFLPHSYMSRLTLLAVIGISLLAGFGFDRIRRSFTPAVTLAIIALAAIDLASLAAPIASQIFVLPAVPTFLADPPWPAASTNQAFPRRIRSVDYNRAYLAAKQGYGTMAYCSVLGPDPAPHTIEEGGTAAASATPQGQLEVLDWTPNGVTLKVAADQEGDLLLHTNFAEGWTANGLPAHDRDGLVATTISPGTHTVEFLYRPPLLNAGLVISGLFVITATAVSARIIWHAHIFRTHRHSPPE